MKTERIRKAVQQGKTVEQARGEEFDLWWSESVMSDACGACAGPLQRLGQLGSRLRLRCRNCGLDSSREAS